MYRDASLGYKEMHVVNRHQYKMSDIRILKNVQVEFVTYFNIKS